ncbi:MAG: hypothetical protein M1491_03700 [Deltaproteobacteria bacterium]|nr:hypothetical protein [Deltaproteobacteria bacterium]MCL5276494.1 hypothetical protein [Deltaproteobacteria bacterium]
MSVEINLDASFEGLSDGLEDIPIVMGIFDDYIPPHGYAGIVDWEVCGEISRMIAGRKFSGNEGARLLLRLTSSCYPGRKVLVYGLGSRKGLTSGRLSSVMEGLFSTLSGLSISNFVYVLPPMYDAGSDIHEVLDGIALSVLKFTSRGKTEYRLWLMWDNVSRSDIVSSFKDAVNVFPEASLSIIEKED